MPKPTCLVLNCAKTSHRAGRCAAHYAHALAAGECGSSKPCNWIDCDLLGVNRGFCGTHYARSRKVGHASEPWVAWEARVAERAFEQANKKCRWPECERKARGRGFCNMHHQRALKVGNLDEPWKLWRAGGHCTVCGKWADGPKRNQRFCSEVCNIIDWKRRNPERMRELGREHARRRRAQKLATQTEKFTDKDVRLAYGDDCYICGERINFKLKFPHPKSPSVDHVIPLSRGGSHTLGNCAMTHYLCNQKKHTKDAISAPQPTLLSI